MRISEIDRIRERVKKYIEEYYSEVRSQLARYESISNIFPKYLLGFKKVQAFFCRDAMVIAHFASDNDSFEFSVTSLASTEVISRLSTVKLPFSFPPEMEFTLVNEFLYSYQSSDLHKQIAAQVGVDPWDKVLRTPFISTDRWSDKKARSDAAFDISVSLTAHLMNLKKNQTEELFENLKSTIASFKLLLDSKPPEEHIQQFLTDNAVLISPAAIRVLPKLQLGKEYATDFVVEMTPAEYILVEIERADLKLFTKQGDPSGPLKHAHRQVLDWLDWIREYTGYARASMPGITDPECWVVIGRRPEMNSRDIRLLNRMNQDSHHVTILTYDDLITRAEQHLSGLERFWRRKSTNR